MQESLTRQKYAGKMQAKCSTSNMHAEICTQNASKMQYTQYARRNMQAKSRQDAAQAICTHY